RRHPRHQLHAPPAPARQGRRIQSLLPRRQNRNPANVPEYDFSWQTVYYFKQPKAIPAGTKIMVTGFFDNSAKNKCNPDPTKAVRYGEPTYDEMMIGWMDYTADKERAKPSVASKE